MGTEDFTDKFKGLKVSENKDINILLLGETGVGKSTFVNSIANYLHHKHFKKASKGELLILIPCTVTVTDKNFESVSINVGSEDNNEYREVGAAGTQDVKTYVFPIGEGKTRLRFIDSPGMGDPRGIEQDDINCENILAYLSQLKELHAICFLMKPTTTRITVLFEYCVKQILSRLEKSASNNIIFIFTNTRGTNYTPGDTLPCLRKVVDEIKKQPPHVEIPLKNNIFNLDNEAFRYLVATKHNIEYDESAQKRFIESWENSSKECWRLISYIVGDTANEPLKPHQLQNTMSINEARRLVVQLSKPLADISELIYDNIRILDRHKNNLKIDNQTLAELKKKLFIPALDLEVTQLTQPVTVCTSTKCAEMVKVGEVTKPHYRQRCHDPCYLTNVGKEIVGDPNLVHCAAMNGSRCCSKCTCDYLVHMHVYYMSKTVEKNIKDDVVQQNINQKEMALREAQRLIGEIDRRKTELEQERGIIVKSTAEFAHFLQNNAISPFNDSYRAYIQYLISREQSYGRLGDLGAIENLNQLLRQYDEIKAAFDRSLDLTKQLGLNAVVGPQINAQTVIQTIHKLYQLKHNGKKIKELMKKQKTPRTFEYDKSCEYVHPNTTGVYTAEKKKDKSKKKEGKSTDDEKTKKDRKGKGTDDEKAKKDKKGKSTDDEKSKKGQGQTDFKNNPRTYQRGRGNYQNQGNRPYYHEQQSQRPNTSNVYGRENRDPPPPYPGHDAYNNSRPHRSTSSGHDSDSNIVVKVELSQPNKQKKEEQPKYNRQDSYGASRPDHYYPPQGPPPHPSQYHGPPPPPPLLSQYHPPPPHGQYHNTPPPQGQYYSPPPPPGQYHPPQGYYNQGPYQGPPQGGYPGYNYGPHQAPYYGPPQNQYQGHPQDSYSGAPTRGSYQKHNRGGRGRPYQKRGGGTKRNKSKSRGDKGKKSGTERSDSDSESESSE